MLKCGENSMLETVDVNGSSILHTHSRPPSPTHPPYSEHQLSPPAGLACLQLLGTSSGGGGGKGVRVPLIRVEVPTWVSWKKKNIIAETQQRHMVRGQKDKLWSQNKDVAARSHRQIDDKVRKGHERPKEHFLGHLAQPCK